MNRNLRLEHIPPLKWWRRARWVLLEDVQVNTHIVKRGFITDGFSAPWFVSWLVSPTGKAMRSAVLHDFLLSSLKPFESRAYADRGFLLSMKCERVSNWRRYGMFIAVRIFGMVKVWWYKLCH